MGCARRGSPLASGKPVRLTEEAIRRRRAGGVLMAENSDAGKLGEAPPPGSAVEGVAAFQGLG